MGTKKDDKKKLKVKRTAISNLSGVGGGASKGGGSKPHKPASGGSGHRSGGSVQNLSEKLTQASETLEHTMNISVATVQLHNSTGGGQQ